MSVALVTGASRGLGYALAAGLAAAGWSLVIDGRGPTSLEAAAAELRRAAPGAGVVAVPGDITDPTHRGRLVSAAGDLGGLDVLVNNAGILGPSPQPALATYPLVALREVYEVNVVAQLGVLQQALPLLRRSARPRVVSVSSDAAVMPYAGWGGYGSAKAAIDQLSAVLAVEEPGLRVWTVDPGDLRTRMHQEAFPGEDISDRPEPGSVVPAFLDLLGSDRPSGRIRLADLVPTSASTP